MSKQTTTTKVRSILMRFADANKSASDRNITVMDGRGSTTDVQSGSVTKDPALDDLKKDLPTTGTLPTVANPIGTNPDLTVADARTDTASASIQVDPGLADLKKDIPQGTNMKCASDRVASIAALLAGKKPAEAAAAKSTPAAAATTKSAGQAGDIVLDDTVLVKIAKELVSTEDGIAYAVSMMEKAAGAQKAREFINEAIAAAHAADQQEFMKLAAVDQINNAASRIYERMQSIGMTDEIADGILKQAALHEVALSEMDEIEKAAYAGGAEDAAAMEAAAAGEEGAPPVDEAIPMGGEEPSPEEIQAVIESLLAEGVITPEELEAAIQQAAGGGEAGAGAPPEAAAPAEAPIA
jgi:hypothetical protein